MLVLVVEGPRGQFISFVFFLFVPAIIPIHAIVVIVVVLILFAERKMYRYVF